MWVDVDGETVLYDTVSGRVHLLSRSGSLLWPAFSSPVTIAELAEDVASAFELSVQEATAQVETFCAQLLETGALQEAESAGPGE